jgi:hypothetical protein
MKEQEWRPPGIGKWEALREYIGTLVRAGIGILVLEYFLLNMLYELTR